MPKIKKITELKPRIKEIKKEHFDKKEKSELLEDLEKAEAEEKREASREFSSVSRFKAPAIVLESSVEGNETQQKQTQIQRETEQRREVHERNLTYAPRKEPEQRQTYKSTQYNSLTLETSQTPERADMQPIRQPLFRRVGGEEIRKDVRDEFDKNLLSERQYKEKRRRE